MKTIIKGFGISSWEIDYDDNTIKDMRGVHPFSAIKGVYLLSDTNSQLTHGKIWIWYYYIKQYICNARYVLEYPVNQKNEALGAFNNMQIISKNNRQNIITQSGETNLVYFLPGEKGRNMYVYTDRVVINSNLYNAFTGFMNYTKTIYYCDCLNITYVYCKNDSLGNIYLETQSGNNVSNMHDNGFLFGFYITQADYLEIVKYIEQRIYDYKFNNGVQGQVYDDVNSGANISANISVADEILKYKNLLDIGAITNEEFEQAKARLLGGIN